MKRKRIIIILGLVAIILTLANPPALGVWPPPGRISSMMLRDIPWDRPYSNYPADRMSSSAYASYKSDMVTAGESRNFLSQFICKIFSVRQFSTLIYWNIISSDYETASRPTKVLHN
ncbi:MAG: hypothetical protein NTV06_05030 [candidate division Zixibacteria bacterium]|nr:hypothetical protein [candidate division Zixibacteria bacterium]